MRLEYNNIAFISVEIEVPKNELREFIEGDLRGTIDARACKRKMNSKDELAATKEALSRVTREMDEIRAQLLKIRGENVNSEFAFGFSPGEFNSMNYTSGLAWIASELTPKIKAEVTKYPTFFKMANLMGSSKVAGIRMCARFNRGEVCKPDWHVHNKPNKKGHGLHQELRLHCCAV